jgi:hypothetical protein
MRAHEKIQPLNHIEKFEIIEGDVCETLEKYIEEHPELLVSMVYFDMDLYEPTKYCLERIIKFMPKGSIIGFDELNHPSFPGETRAVKEVIELNKLRLIRLPWAVRPSFCVI